MPALRNIVLVPALLLLATCSREGEHRVERLRIDGIPLVRTTGAPKHAGPLFEITSDLVLGIDDGEPEWQIFGRISSFLVSPDGRLVIQDRQREEIFVVSPEGELLSRLGGHGAGPGEFIDMWYLHWIEVGEEFCTEDWDLDRITHFSMDGSLLETSRMPGYAMLRGRNAFIVSLGNRRFLASMQDRVDNTWFHKNWFTDSELDSVREFMRYPVENTFHTPEGRGFPIPYTSSIQVSILPGENIVVGYPDEGRITVCDMEGNPHMHIERDWPLVPVTTEEKQDLRRRWRESRDQVRARYADKIPIPDRRPPFSRIIPDDRGRIWIERFQGPFVMSSVDSLVYDVFGPDGVWLGVQVLPFRPTVSGDYVYRPYYAESGAPRLERLHLRPIIPEAAGRVNR